MSPARVQLFFFLGICAITLHFSIRLGGGLFHYLSFENSSIARVSQWEIVEIKGRYGLKADYTFEFQEKNWLGSFAFSPPYHLNEMAALAVLKEKAKEKWTAWYNHKNPQISLLEKNFPKGLLFRTLICYGVLIYFATLKRKMRSVIEIS